MTKRLTYSNVAPNALHDQLVAAGVHPSYVGGVAGDPTGVVIECADADEATVAAVVAAHDRAAALAAWDAARQAETQEYGQAPAILAQLDDAIATVQGAGTLTAAQVKAGLLLALRAIRLIVRYELRRRGA